MLRWEKKESILQRIEPQFQTIRNSLIFSASFSNDES